MVEQRFSTNARQEQGRRPRERSNDRPAQTWGIGSRECYALAEGKTIDVCTLDGKVYRLKLKGVDQYDLILEDATGALTLIPKHALKFCRPSNDAQKGKPAESQRQAKEAKP